VLQAHWPGSAVPTPTELREFNRVLRQAVLGYQARPYAGPAVLLQPIRRPKKQDFRKGWAGMVRGEFTAIDVPGDHLSMVQEPDLRKLGATMSLCLGHAQPPPG